MRLRCLLWRPYEVDLPDDRLDIVGRFRLLHDRWREISRVYAKQLQALIPLRWLATTAAPSHVFLRGFTCMVIWHELVAIASMAKLGLVSMCFLRVGYRNALLLCEEKESLTNVIILHMSWSEIFDLIW